MADEKKVFTARLTEDQREEFAAIAAELGVNTMAAALDLMIARFRKLTTNLRAEQQENHHLRQKVVTQRQAAKNYLRALDDLRKLADEK